MTTPTNKSFGLLADSEALKSLINEAKIPLQIEVVAEVESTQKSLLTLNPEELPVGKTLVAHHQSAGIGRLDRTWESQSGDSVLMSQVFRHPNLHLPYFVGNAVVKALRKYSPRIGLKWPNDLVVEKAGQVRKLGGMVLQRHQQDDSIVVAGIGINLQFSKSRPTEEAIALNELISDLPDINQLIFEIILELTKAQPKLFSEYKENCLTLGKEVVVQMLKAKDVKGLAVDISDNGALVIQTSDGIVEVLTGDVKHLRTSE